VLCSRSRAQLETQGVEYAEAPKRANRKEVKDIPQSARLPPLQRDQHHLHRQYPLSRLAQTRFDLVDRLGNVGDDVKIERRSPNLRLGFEIALTLTIFRWLSEKADSYPKFEFVKIS
jgi:hypothetical protein